MSLEFERYPEWAKDVKRAVVLTRDDNDRPSEVEFTGGGDGSEHELHPAVRLLRRPRAPCLVARPGRHHEDARGLLPLRPFGDEPRPTDVTYDLTVEVVVPLPGFVKRRAEVRILHSLLELKARVEQ